MLKDGQYGALVTTKTASSKINIVAENAQGAVFDKVEVKGGSNLAFDGLEVKGQLQAWYFAKDITITNTKVAQFYFSRMDGLTVDRSEAADGYFNILLNSVKNFKITNSYFHGATEDVSRVTGDSYNGLLENNIFSDVKSYYPLHADLMQFFGSQGYTPHDITIRGNLFWDDTKTGSVAAQGIFMANAGPGGFKNIMIEENLIAARHINTVFINGGQENVVIRNNTLLATSDGNTAVLRLSKSHGYDNSGTEVYGNAMKGIIDDSKSSHIHDNLIYGRIDPATIFHGNVGSKWEDFVPRTGSSVDFGSGYGALGRLTELLAGEDGGSGVGGGPSPEEEEDPHQVFGLQQPMDFSGKIDSRVMYVADRGAFDLNEGTISFDFNAKSLSWRHGLVSKDSAEKGDDFAAWLEHGTLFVRFGDGEGREEVFSVSGVTSKTDYNFVASFDEDGAKAWLNGKLIGETDLHMNWMDNDETLVLGAENALSASGSTSAARYAYAGKISDFAIHDQAMTPEELQAHISAQTLLN